MSFDLGSILNMFPGVGSGNLGAASVIPSLATAYNQYQNAGRYEDIGNEAASMASPVSNETRQLYQQRLNQLYTDPAKFLQGNPEFMASMRLGEDKINAMNAANGFNLSGKMTNDQLEHLSRLSSQYINQERDDLMNMGGFQFNPASGAEMKMRGAENGLLARMSALDALMAPLGLQANQNRIANGGGGGGGSPNGGGGGGGGMPSGLGNAWNSLSGLFGKNTGFGPGLAELYGNPSQGNWNYMPEGWVDKELGPWIQGGTDTLENAGGWNQDWFSGYPTDTLDLRFDDFGAIDDFLRNFNGDFGGFLMGPW